MTINHKQQTYNRQTSAAAQWLNYSKGASCVGRCYNGGENAHGESFH